MVAAAVASLFAIPLPPIPPISPLALALVLLAAGAHAGWNFTLHETSDRVATMAIAGLVAGVVLLPVTLALPPWRVLPLILLSALAEAAYALCLSAAYQRGALAVAYPIGRGTAPVLVTLGGWLVLSQPPGLFPLIGACLLLAGLTLIALAGRRHGQSAAVLFALLTGVAIATYSLIDARAVGTPSVSPPAYLGAVLGVQGLLLTGWLRFDMRRLRRAIKPGALVALGTVGAYVLVLFAFQHAGAGRVATLREVSVLIGVFLSRGQRGWHIWLGAGVVVLGVILTAI